MHQRPELEREKNKVFKIIVAECAWVAVAVASKYIMMPIFFFMNQIKTLLMVFSLRRTPIAASKPLERESQPC